MQTKAIGITLTVIGLIMMIYTGFTYVTTEEVVDLGSINITKEKDHPVRWSPIAGGILLLGGVVLIATSKSKK